MPSKFKKMVRARREKTGEKHEAAQRHVRAQAPERQSADGGAGSSPVGTPVPAAVEAKLREASTTGDSMSEVSLEAATRWQADLGKIYASGVAPEDVLLLDLNLGTDIGWRTFRELDSSLVSGLEAAPSRGLEALLNPMATAGHAFIPVRFDKWRARSLPEVARLLDQARRPGHTSMLVVPVDEAAKPGEHRVGVRLVHPHPTHGAEVVRAPLRAESS